MCVWQKTKRSCVFFGYKISYSVTMKFNQKKSTKLTLSERIASALTLKPRADIEDDQVFGTKPQTVSRADFESSDSEDEAAISDFRKHNVNLLSEVSKKYEGKVVSQKDIANSENEDYSSDKDEIHGINQQLSESENESQITKTKPVQSDSDLSDDAESDDYSITKLTEQSDSIDRNSDESDDDDEAEGYDISQMVEPTKEEFEHVKKQNVSEEAKKGICVRNQLLVWESLLEMRIHLQRCMNTANQMPMPGTFEELNQNNEFIEENKTTKANIANVLDKLLILQNVLLKNYPETKTLSNKKRDKKVAIKEEKKTDSDEEIPSDTDNEEIPSDTETEEECQEKKPIKTIKSAKKRKLEDYETEVAMSHKALKTFRDMSIQKWNDKTRLATATNVKNTPTNTVLQQISYILSDRDKLVRRTQLKRSEYDIIGYNNQTINVESKDQNGSELNPVTRDRKDNDEYIPEIFDDSDFYHQLLRELIECKSADISDPVQLSRQWIALQQMRSKMKRKVDTKATKGRKIKYVVHNKLVNYMAPEKCTTWTDESTNELYSSLFGKLFEHNNVGLHVNVGNVYQLK